MSKSNRPNVGKVEQTQGTGTDSVAAFPERVRMGHVMGEADMEYGMVSGFRSTIEHTGSRHKLSPLGRKVKGG